MASIRESIVRVVIDRCQAAIAPAEVIRQPVRPVTREQCPALLLSIESDSARPMANDRAERILAVRLTVLVRDAPGDDAWALADELACRAHAALMVDPSLGGLALRIEAGDVDWQADDADVDAIAVPWALRIVYRTLVSDITKGG